MAVGYGTEVLDIDAVVRDLHGSGLLRKQQRNQQEKR